MNTTPPSVRKVVIVGGGTAGWMSAISLTSHFNDLKVVVIDPSKVGPIGVGESVTGAVQRFVGYPGHNLSMRDFFRNADATLKLGIWYKDWTKVGQEYLTPIDSPLSYFDHHYYQDIEDFYASATARGLLLSEVQLHSPLMRANKTDYYRENGAVSSRLSMASCHFDALKFAAWLKADCIRRPNVQHVDDVLTGFQQDAETGFIQSVTTEGGQTIEGDFFLDCSGFRRLLLEQAYKPRWIDFTQHIRVDSAVPSPVQYGENESIPVYTQATAMPHGWMWQVPTQSRLGKGYLFSSRYVDDEQAFAEMRAAGLDPGESPQVIRFRPGKLASVFSGNVCAIGLAGGFIEALEATTIHLMHGQIKALTELYLPFFTRASSAALATKYNRLLDSMYDDYIDFISCHYHTGRDDTEFWRDYQKPDAFTERNRERIELWKHRYPVREDFTPQISDRFFATTSLIVWMPMLSGLRMLNPDSAKRFIQLSKFQDLAKMNFQKYTQIRDFVRDRAVDQREAIAVLTR